MNTTRISGAVAISLIWIASALASYFTKDTSPFFFAFWATVVISLFGT